MGKQKTYTDKTKLNPAALDDAMKSKATKQSVCARNNRILPRIHHNIQLSWACSQNPLVHNTWRVNVLWHRCVRRSDLLFPLFNDGWHPTSMVPTFCTGEWTGARPRYHLPSSTLINNNDFQNCILYPICYTSVPQETKKCKRSKQWVTFMSDRPLPRMRRLCQSSLTRRAPDVVNALRTVGHYGGSEVKYCSVSCTDWLFRVFRPHCIVKSCRV